MQANSGHWIQYISHSFLNKNPIFIFLLFFSLHNTTMPIALISPAEKKYIEQGVEEDCRADGRARLEYRHVVLETGILAQASGSARCRLGDSDVLVGVKVEIGEPEQDKPTQGRVICSVEW
jgi:exosome complex component RRP42